MFDVQMYLVDGHGKPVPHLMLSPQQEMKTLRRTRRQRRETRRKMRIKTVKVSLIASNEGKISTGLYLYTHTYTPSTKVYFYYFLHCRVIVMISKYLNYEITGGNQKSVKQIKIYLRFFKVASLCLDESLVQS